MDTAEGDKTQGLEADDSAAARPDDAAQACEAQTMNQRTDARRWGRDVSMVPDQLPAAAAGEEGGEGEGGVLVVWQNQQVSPGTAGIGPVIDLLIIAVVGGIGRPIGAFIGALIYVLLRTFAIDVLDGLGLGGERFQLLIGMGFLLIVFFSPDGVLGLWDRWRARRRRAD